MAVADLLVSLGASRVVQDRVPACGRHCPGWIRFVAAFGFVLGGSSPQRASLNIGSSSDSEWSAHPLYMASRARVYPDCMNVELTPDQRAFVQRAIESGRFSGEEEAVQEALALWEERERRRLEILAMLDEADASFARGEGIPITEESMKALAEEAKQRLRRRIEPLSVPTSR